MYSQEDLNSIRLQKKQRWLKLSVPAAVLLAGVIVSFVYRIEWVTTLLSCILGSFILFSYEMLIKPLSCYEKFIDGCLNGRTHKLEGTYLSAEEDISLIDGVRYVGMHINDDNPENNYERLFYFDVEKPMPDLQPGDKVHVVYHGNSLVSLVRA